MNLPARGSVIAEFEPHPLWRYFTEIAAVPRPSKKEERIRAYVRSVADRHRLAWAEDGAGNLVITVPATTGFAKAPITVLQAHLDMVCEKNESTRHDFSSEGIHLIADNEVDSGLLIVRADGTTLGADNGIGVAMALAAATTPEVTHGPLELLFTVDEEQGMGGARGVTPDSFRGRTMLNLDSEEESTLYIGCAGGCDVNLTWDFETVPMPQNSALVRLRVSGLRGGHSGVDIHEGRSNAIKLLARTLLHAKCDSLHIFEISGGSKRNAIPREASALVAVPAGLMGLLKQAATEVAREASTESGESNVTIGAESLSGRGTTNGLSAGDSRGVLSALAALPSGVIGMHPKVPGLVETSNNVSTVGMNVQDSRAIVDVGLLTRSSSASRMQEAVDQLTAIGTLAGAKATYDNAYPGWSPNIDSPTLAVCRRVHKELFGDEPKVAAIHAGLECGIIGERVGDMDMVSLGPTIRGAHSPDERVYVASVKQTWEYLVALLGAFARATGS